MSNIGPWTHVALRFPKKRRLGPQNGSGSLGPEKLLKIVNRELECIVPYSLGDGVRPVSEWVKLAVGSSEALLLQM